MSACMCACVLLMSVFAKHVYHNNNNNIICWQLPSNQSFYRQFAGYGKELGHHKVGQW